MTAAIIGSGFSGLGVGWHLLQRGRKVVFFEDPERPGASLIASGLLHPYAGEHGRRSWKASEALLAAQSLLAAAEEALGRPVAEKTGIVRLAFKPDHIETFRQHARSFGDIQVWGEDAFLITSGITVHAQEYVEGLKLACSKKGAVFIKKKIESFQELEDFDRIVIAAGAETLRFFPELAPQLSRTKGQVLLYSYPEGYPAPQHNLVAKGYVLNRKEKQMLIVGSTYERDYSSEDPDLEPALRELAPKLKTFIPNGAPLQSPSVRSAMRLGRKGHYYPLVRRMGEKCWVMTGMGSRGLLYHAYIGEQLAEALVQDANAVRDLQLCNIV